MGGGIAKSGGEVAAGGVARGRAHGRAIVPHGPFFLSADVMRTGRGGCLAIHAWDKPEVVPPGITCAVGESLLGGATPLFSDNDRGARGCCVHNPIFDCSFRRHAVFGPKIVFAKGARCFRVPLSIFGRLHFSNRPPSVRVGYRSLQRASKIDAGGLAGSHTARQANATSRTMPHAEDCA